jgi:hypothetical protein
VREGIERCELCGLRLHRFSPNDPKHAPTAVACANSIIGLIETTYDEECTRPISGAVTALAFEIARLQGLSVKAAKKRGSTT